MALQGTPKESAMTAYPELSASIYELLEKQKNRFVATKFIGRKVVMVFCDDRNIPFAYLVDAAGVVHEIPSHEIWNFDVRASQSLKVLQAYINTMRLDLKSYLNGEFGLQITGSLLGGGFWTVAAGLITTGASIAGMVGTLGMSAPVSAAGLGAGISLIKRGLTTKDELSWDLAADVAANAAAGAVTAGMGSYLAAGKAVKAGVDATKATVTVMQAVGRGAASGAAGAVTGATVKAVVHRRLPSGEELATSLLIGAFSGGVGGSISKVSAETGTKIAKTLVVSVIKKNIQKFLDLGVPPEEIYKVLRPVLTPENFEIAVNITEAALRTSAGATAGSITAGATKIAANLVNGKEADDGVLDAMATGAVIGGITAMEGHGGKGASPPPVSKEAVEEAAKAAPLDSAEEKARDGMPLSSEKKVVGATESKEKPEAVKSTQVHEATHTAEDKSKTTAAKSPSSEGVISTNGDVSTPASGGCGSDTVSAPMTFEKITADLDLDEKSKKIIQDTLNLRMTPEEIAIARNQVVEEDRSEAYHTAFLKSGHMVTFTSETPLKEGDAPLRSFPSVGRPVGKALESILWSRLAAYSKASNHTEAALLKKSIRALAQALVCYNEGYNFEPIRSLKVGDCFLIPYTVPGHILYINVIKESEGYAIKIYNCQRFFYKDSEAECQMHQRTSDNKKAFPWVFNASLSGLDLYLNALVRAFQDTRVDAYSYIYGLDPSLKGILHRRQDLEIKSEPWEFQTVGNCTQWSLSAAEADLVSSEMAVKFNQMQRMLFENLLMSIMSNTATIFMEIAISKITSGLPTPK